MSDAETIMKLHLHDQICCLYKSNVTTNVGHPRLPLNDKTSGCVLIGSSSSTSSCYFDSRGSRTSMTEVAALL